MSVSFPGSVVPRQGKTAKEFLDGLFFATKGLMLLQVREITGLDTPAIQNWINRGWVPRPVEKRYSADHLARILLINLLRPAARLENIAKILAYINGDTEDPSDNAIPDATLYCIVCDILDRVDFETVLTGEALTAVIEGALGDYTEPFPGAREKLLTGIRLILLYYASAVIKVRADRMLTAMGLGEDGEENGGEADAGDPSGSGARRFRFQIR